MNKQVNKHEKELKKFIDKLDDKLYKNRLQILEYITELLDLTEDEKELIQYVDLKCYIRKLRNI